MAPAMFIALIVFLLTGSPVAFSLAALGLASGMIAIEFGFFPAQFMANLPYRVFGILSNELLLSIPFFTVDLSARKVSYTSANSNKKEINFEIDDYTRWRLMEGLDDIGLTMKRIDQVEKFESERHTKFAFKPKTLPVNV